MSVITTRVFEIAEREGLSMRALAAAMGVSHQYLYAVRSGKSRIGVKFLQGAALAFPGYPLDWLFPREPAVVERVS